tara:strand:+ start:175 stop:468 length:294 start_codon:yes stop_codon:yes gene_type:complete
MGRVAPSPTRAFVIEFFLEQTHFFSHQFTDDSFQPSVGHVVKVVVERDEMFNAAQPRAGVATPCAFKTELPQIASFFFRQFRELGQVRTPIGHGLDS